MTVTLAAHSLTAVTRGVYSCCPFCVATQSKEIADLFRSLAVRALKYSSCLCLALVLGLGSPISARSQPATPTPALDGLFLPLGGGLSAEVRGAIAESVQRGGVPAGVIRSRRVAIDFALLGERVRGLLGRPEADPVQDQAPLVLNFFDDASVEVLVDAVEPAVLGNGYVVNLLRNF